MVKYVYKKKPFKKEVREKRASRYRVSRVTNFIDPHPGVLGTVPEKIVYNELFLRGIDARFRSDFTVDLPDADIFKVYKPDFVLTAERIIIEVQGSYWHSSKEAIEADSFKQALYTMMGYKVLAWWDYDIESDVDRLFAQEPALAYRRIGSTITTDDPLHDDLKGLRTQNRSRKKPLKYKSVRYGKTKSKNRVIIKL